MLLGQIPIAVAPVSPGDEFAAPGFLKAPTARAFDNLGTFVFGDHPLHLCQEFALRSVAEGILEEDHWRVELLELLHQQPLIGVFAREPIRIENDDGIEFATPGAVAQSIERRAVDPRATKTIVEKFMLWQQAPSLLLHVLFEQLDLGGNRALQFLIESRDSGVDRYLHFAPPGVRE